MFLLVKRFLLTFGECFTYLKLLFMVICLRTHNAYKVGNLVLVVSHCLPGSFDGFGEWCAFGGALFLGKRRISFFAVYQPLFNVFLNRGGFLLVIATEIWIVLAGDGAFGSWTRKHFFNWAFDGFGFYLPLNMFFAMIDLDVNLGVSSLLFTSAHFSGQPCFDVDALTFLQFNRFASFLINVSVLKRSNLFLSG